MEVLMSLLLATSMVAVLTYGASVPFTLLPQDPFAQLAGDSVPTDTDTPPLAAADRRFLAAAAQDNLAAVAALALLSQRTQNIGLRNFARRIARQRGRLQDALEVLAIRKDVTLPTRPDAAALAVLAQVERSGAEGLDQAWTLRYAGLAQRTAARYALAGPRLRDAEVRAFAAQQSDRMRCHERTADDGACGGPARR
ncbi:MAG: hypothetical protein NVS9B10_02740 [Nevskia sp.]